MTTASDLTPVRRLFLLCGPPKTGSSAVQYFFWTHRGLLLESFGILYPDLVSGPGDPRHLFLQEELIRDLGFRGLRHSLAEAARTDAHTLVLASEGLVNQSVLFDQALAQEFLRLTRDWQVDFVFVLRDRSEWLVSRYRQHVLNPRRPGSSHPIERLHGTGLPFRTWVQDSELHAQMDPEALRIRFTSVFGPCGIRFIEYGPNVVKKILATLGLETNELPVDGLPRVNMAPPDPFVEVLRRINALPHWLRLEAAAGTAVRSATVSNHIALANSRQSHRIPLLLLVVALGGMKWSPNPPLNVTPESFDHARRRVAKAAWQIARSSSNPSRPG
jgi:hypothetical protein